MPLCSTTIVGYVFNASIYCPGHIIDALPTGEGEAFDGWAVGTLVDMTVEENLDEIAFAFQIERQDEATFDSSEFPKVIFASQVAAEDCCETCGEPLT